MGSGRSIVVLFCCLLCTDLGACDDYGIKDRFVAAKRVFLARVVDVHTQASHSAATSGLDFSARFEVLESYKGVVAEHLKHDWTSGRVSHGFDSLQAGQRWLIFDRQGRWSGPCSSTRKVDPADLPNLRGDMQALRDRIGAGPVGLVRSRDDADRMAAPAGTQKRSLGVASQPSQVFSAAQWLQQAQAALRQQRVREAEIALHRSLMRPSSAQQRQQALMLLASIAEERGRRQAAEGYLREAVRLNQNNPAPMRALSALLEGRP